jgi:L-threonylcarbamoyladenylate synthase
VSARITQTHAPELFERAVAEAVALLRQGAVVALPTETVYGLAANALDEKAVARIFEIKGRPSHNPVIVHVSSLAMARDCVSDWPPLAEALARAFWPGPLTLVLPRSARIPDGVTAGGGTVGIRWPGHPFMQAVIQACGFPLAAPSANLSNQLSPTNADHVRKDLGEKVPLIVDGGQSQVGIESTVLDLTTTPPRLLRPGMIHAEALRAVTGGLQSGQGDAPGAPLRSPGLLLKHYSPRARLRVLSWRDEADLQQQLASHGAVPSSTFILSHTHIPLGRWEHVFVVPHDPEAFGRALYSELHRCDAMGAEWIVVEAVPKSPEWHAIADRLSRAAAE